jgi:hypothetical protein
MVPALVLAFTLALQAPGEPPARPAWVEKLPEAQGRLYALGTADLGPQEGQAIARASDRARLEVVARLKATVKGQTQVTTRTRELHREGQKALGAGERVTRDEVSVGAKAEELPGLVVEQIFTDAPARTVYALAYLDLAQARTTLAARLDRVREGRARAGRDLTRKALWKLRKLALDLDRLDETLAMLALAGGAGDLRPRLEAERTAVEARLDQLNQADLPPVEFSRMAMALHSNVDLPLGVEAYLRSRVVACGLLARETDPDLVLELTFSGGDKGPEFIHADLDVYTGLTYRLEAGLCLTEGGGAPLTRSVPILVVQGDTPEGMVNQFRKQIDRWLPRLLGEFKAEMQ